jgi:hypothetical protein
MRKVDADGGIEKISHSQRKMASAARDVNQQAPMLGVAPDRPPDKSKFAP